jgi:hypothetical protein
VVGTERNDGLSSQLAKGRRGLARQAERYTRSAFERSRQHAVLGDAFRSNPRTVAFRSSVASERGALEKVRERGGRADQQARWSQTATASRSIVETLLHELGNRYQPRLLVETLECRTVGGKPPPGIRTDGGMQVDGVRRGLGEPRCHTKDRSLIEALDDSSDKFK